MGNEKGRPGAPDCEDANDARTKAVAMVTSIVYVAVGRVIVITGMACVFATVSLETRSGAAGRLLGETQRRPRPLNRALLTL